MASTLIGIAQDEGRLDIDDRASDYITEWRGTPSEGVTIRDLLSNDSGRFWTFASDYLQMPAAPSNTDFAVALGQQHPPDAHWQYNNASIQTLGARSGSGARPWRCNPPRVWCSPAWRR